MPNYILGWFGGSVAENSASASIGYLDLDIGAFPAPIDTIVITGPGGATYSVDPFTFEVTVTGALDFETMATSQLNVLITFLDGSDNGGEMLNFSVTDVAEAPDGLILSANSVNEDAAVNTVVATLTGSDPEGGALTYALISGAGFSVVGNELRVSGPLDHEANGSVNVVISVTDAQNHVTQFTRAITIADIAEAPDGLTLSANSVNENAAVNTVVATLTGSDPEGGALAYALVSGAGFSVVGNELRVSGPLDHEANGSVNVVISVTDAQNHVTQFTRAITIADVNEAPTLLPFAGVTSTAIGENAAAGREVARITVTEPDLADTAIFSLTGPDAALFVLDGLRVRLANGVSLDHDTAPVLNFGVRVTDGGGLHADQAFTVRVDDVVSQAASLQAVLGGGNGTAVGLTVVLGDDGPVLHLGGNTIVLTQNTLATADGQLAFGDATDLAQIERLYLGLAGRAATGAERMAAADAWPTGGMSGLAERLLHGTEFTAYVQGHSAAQDVDGLTNGEFANMLYGRLLGRGADSPGLAFWTDGLDQGLVSRADVAGLMAFSGEARLTYSAQTQALWAVDAQAYQVRSLYDVALNREPDAGGLAFWRSVLEQGVSMHDVAEYIADSPEFQAQISGMTTGQVLEMFYQNGLERASDVGGKAFWTAVIDNGLGDWGDVLLGFANSSEQDDQLASYRAGTDIFVV